MSIWIPTKKTYNLMPSVLKHPSLCRSLNMTFYKMILVNFYLWQKIKAPPCRCLSPLSKNVIHFIIKYSNQQGLVDEVRINQTYILCIEGPITKCHIILDFHKENLQPHAFRFEAPFFMQKSKHGMLPLIK